MAERHLNDATELDATGNFTHAMEWVLIIGIALTGIGIFVGLYLPILAAHFATPEKIRLYMIIGAVRV